MKRGNRTNITLLDVAKHAGVSRSSASLVLRESPLVSDKTREKVLESIKDLGYIYDRGAANLRSKSSDAVGVIFTDLDNPFYTAMFLGLNQEFNKFNKTVILGTTFDSCATQEKLISTMLEYRVAGLIMFAAPGTPKDLIDRLKNLDIPVVLINRKLPEPSFDYIGVDNVMAGILATEHLIKKGHQKIAFLGGFSKLSSWQERKEGYKTAHRQAGLDVDSTFIIEGPITRESGYELMGKILEMKDLPTAVFCFNDIVAIGAMMKLKENGMTPGYDMAVVGVDDTPEASIFTPKITTVSSFPRERGVRAANLLCERIEGLDTEPQSIIIEPKLIERESSFYKDDLNKETE